MSELFKLLYPTKYYRDYINENIRPDGRNFDSFRPVALTVNPITTADGSAIVKLGETTILCSIRAELAPPEAANPDIGYLVPNLELTSFCNPKYRSGGTEDAELYTETINNILVNSGCIDLKDLCIYQKGLVWCLFCDITCLNHDGSVVDAAVIAVVAALKSLKLPKVTYDPLIKSISVDPEIKTGINLNALPVSTTITIFDDKTITDPTSDEENVSKSVISIAISNSAICFLVKPGGSPVSQEQMNKCISQALIREKDIMNLYQEEFENKSETA